MAGEPPLDDALVAIHAELVGRVTRLRQRIGPELAPELDDLLARHALLADPGALLHPLGQPLVELPRWFAARAARAGQPLAAEEQLDLIEATVVGYLHVRIEDDWIDEGIGHPTLGPLLSDTCLVRHQALVARLVGSSERFWEAFERVAFAYGDAMALERRLHEPGAVVGAADFDAILRRSQPLVLPGLVVLDRIDRWDLVDSLEELVRRATRAGQLVTDLLDCEHDLEVGNHTWVVRRLGGAEGRGAMLANLVRGGWQTITSEADADLVAAAACAARLGFPEAEGWLDRRRQAVDDLGVALARRLVDALREQLGAAETVDNITIGD